MTKGMIMKPTKSSREVVAAVNQPARFPLNGKGGIMETHHHGQHKNNQYKEHVSAIDPICGMEVDIVSDSLHHEFNEKSYFFCSEHCLAKFKDNPKKIIKPPKNSAEKNSASENQEFKDPVCGMFTDDPDAYQQYEHNGKKYYFCSGHCLTKVKNDPEEFISGKRQQQSTIKFLR